MPGVLAETVETSLELFRNVSVHEFYHFKGLIALEQLNTTEWSKKKKNLN